MIPMITKYDVTLVTDLGSDNEEYTIVSTYQEALEKAEQYLISAFYDPKQDIEEIRADIARHDDTVNNCWPNEIKQGCHYWEYHGQGFVKITQIKYPVYTKTPH